MYKALFCGDRDWANKEAHPSTWQDEYDVVGKVMDDLLLVEPALEIIHGSARGADLLSDDWATRLEIPRERIHAFPAYWNCRIYEEWNETRCKVDGIHSVTHGLAAGPIRNQLMIDQEPDLVVAFHDNIAGSKGTKDMVFKAEKIGIRTIVVRHDGEF